MSLIENLLATYQSIARYFARYLESVAQLVLRLIVARVFLSSGLTKWSAPFQFNTEKYDLFLYEFFCPDPPRPGALQLCDADTLEYVEGSLTVNLVEFSAITAGVMEIFLPVLLIVGLLTRFAAIGLLAMTVFIQIAVFPSWEHWWNPAVWWASALLVIVAQGPGRWSLDGFLRLEGAGGGTSGGR